MNTLRIKDTIYTPFAKFKPVAAGLWKVHQKEGSILLTCDTYRECTTDDVKDGDYQMSSKGDIEGDIEGSIHIMQKCRQCISYIREDAPSYPYVTSILLIFY